MSEREFRDKLRFHLGCYHLLAAQKRRGTFQHEMGMPFIGFTVGLMALSVLFTWLHNNTQRSIWTAIFFHWLYTYSVQVVASGVMRSPLYNWVEYVPYVVTASIVVIISPSFDWTT